MSDPKNSIPKSIAPEVHTALEHFPELQQVPIEFKFKKNIKKSVMQAQPSFYSIFKSKKHRGYKILINEKFRISGEEINTADLPSDVLIGWIGHELGHVMDYQQRSGLDLVGFGFRYLFSEKFLKSAERTADSFAVSRGMSEYIITTKRFILDHANISPAYKERIKQFYLSPDEIMEMVKNQDALPLKES